MLELHDVVDNVSVQAEWIDNLFGLGVALERVAEKFAGRQLVVGLSVPTREFAAVLIALGWTVRRTGQLARQHRRSDFEAMQLGKHYRVVTKGHVLWGEFRGFDDSRSPARINLAGAWSVDVLQDYVEAEPIMVGVKQQRPQRGSLSAFTGVTENDDARLLTPRAEVVLVGSERSLREEINSLKVARSDHQDTERIQDLLLPKSEDSATWASELLSVKDLEARLPLNQDNDLVVLDGAAAQKYLWELQTPVVVCVLDRSIASQEAVDQLITLRNTRGKPVQENEISWAPIGAIETLTFALEI